MPDLIVVSSAVEGIVDEAVVRRLLEQTGAKLGKVYGKNGKSSLRQRLAGYNQAARFSPWIILVDLNHDADCVPPFCKAWLLNPAPYLCFRVAVREVEAWLMADRENLARFLGTSIARIPRDPEGLDDAKREMINLAGHSKRREIREDMVPRPGSRRSVGPAYPSRLIEFVTSHWRPEVAQQNSDSLRRCLRRLAELLQ